ncbi:hypothetical protein TNCV_4580311 [Trichonephila clavipes]|nr:hypothetical protein TNCV_4580311 [Trichonephila clavipes]
MPASSLFDISEKECQKPVPAHQTTLPGKCPSSPEDDLVNMELKQSYSLFAVRLTSHNRLDDSLRWRSIERLEDSQPDAKIQDTGHPSSNRTEADPKDFIGSLPNDVTIRHIALNRWAFSLGKVLDRSPIDY